MKAGIIDVEVLEEGYHCEVLVVETLKVGRETTTREATCDVGALGSPYSRPSTLGPAKVRRSMERHVRACVQLARRDETPHVQYAGKMGAKIRHFKNRPRSPQRRHRDRRSW